MPEIGMPFVFYVDTEKFIISPSHSSDKQSRINMKLFVTGGVAVVKLSVLSSTSHQIYPDVSSFPNENI